MSLVARRAHFYYYTPIRVGGCFPGTCSEHDVGRLAHQIGRGFAVQGRVSQCETRKQATEFAEGDMYELFALIVVISLLSIVVLATFADLVSSRSKKDHHHQIITVGVVIVEKRKRWYSWLTQPSEYLLAFSFTRNASSLLTVKPKAAIITSTDGSTTTTSNTELSCLHGIRFWTMAWIVLGHTAVWIHYEAFARSYNITNVLTPFYAQAFFNTTLSVDTFFFISGLLTSYITWTATGGGRRDRFNSLMFIVSRYIRLTPGLAFSIALVFLLPRFGSGPLWRETVEPIVNGCRENWWVNLIYMHNYINAERICLLPSWWLANDMHFHILSLAVLLALMRRQSLGQAANAVIVVGFTVAAAVDSYYHDYPPTILSTHPQVDEVWTDLVLRHFYRPYLHAGPFFGGLALGVVLAKQQFPKISQTQVYVGWAVAMITFFLVLKGPYAWTIGEHWSRAGAAVFCATNRLFWTASLAWIVWSCSAGHGGAVNTFLSWRPFAPLARMTYMVYLTHMLLIWTYMGSRRQLLDASLYTGVYMFIPHWFIAYLIGFLCTVLCESPFLALQKLMFARASVIKSSSSSDDDDGEAIGLNNNDHPFKSFNNSNKNNSNLVEHVLLPVNPLSNSNDHYSKSAKDDEDGTADD